MWLLLLIYFYCLLVFVLLCADHQNLQQRFEKKERECEAKNKEKDDMMALLNKMKDKLERESSDHKQAKQQLEELQARLQQPGAVRPPHISTSVSSTSVCC